MSEMSWGIILGWAAAVLGRIAWDGWRAWRQGR